MSFIRPPRTLSQYRHCICDALLRPDAHSTSIRHLATAGPLNEPDVSPEKAPTVDSHGLSLLKRPTRGGQDLSQRFSRLERSIRGKTQYGREIVDLREQQDDEGQAPYTSQEHTQEASTHAGMKTQRIFKGFVIPVPPKPPADDECCMSNCAVCVYDLYDEARQDYVQALDKLRLNLEKKGVPESEWPSDIRRKQSSPQPVAAQRDVALSAFEQFERALKEKKERERQQAQGQSEKAGEGQYTVS
ncbi:hypothetical protein GY45DRAFT_1315365 [Cubamyces sp. BRFM 1775]|nr:hypothetical protein GY45DRAFT_1315365 [Cubamyces sp. BRFM 1775]